MTRAVPGSRQRSVQRMMRWGMLLQFGTLLVGAAIGFAVGVWVMP